LLLIFKLPVNNFMQGIQTRQMFGAKSAFAKASGDKYFLIYCLRLSFPVFKQPECGSFQSEVFATAANISSAFGKNFRRLAYKY